MKHSSGRFPFCAPRRNPPSARRPLHLDGGSARSAFKAESNRVSHQVMGGVSRRRRLRVSRPRRPRRPRHWTKSPRRARKRPVSTGQLAWSVCGAPHQGHPEQGRAPQRPRLGGASFPAVPNSLPTEVFACASQEPFYTKQQQNKTRGFLYPCVPSGRRKASQATLNLRAKPARPPDATERRRFAARGMRTTLRTAAHHDTRHRTAPARSVGPPRGPPPRSGSPRPLGLV